MVRAGVQTAAGAAGAAQLLTAPVVRSAGRVVGTASNSHRAAAPSVRWHTERRLHVDLDPLLPFPRWHQHAEAVERVARKVPGVSSAHVERALGRLVVEHEESVDGDTMTNAVRDAVTSIAVDGIDHEPAPRIAPFADPGDPAAMLVPLTAAALDVVAVGAAVAGWLSRLPAAPRTARAAVAVLNQPGCGRSWSRGWPGEYRDRAQRLLRRGAWACAFVRHTIVGLGASRFSNLRSRGPSPNLGQREPEMASPQRPQAPVVPVISSIGAARSHPAPHSPTVSPHTSWSTGPSTRRLTPPRAQCPARSSNTWNKRPTVRWWPPRARCWPAADPRPSPTRSWLRYPKQLSTAGKPSPRCWPRAGRKRATGARPGALRRLDRIQVIVIDGAALRGDARAVLRATGGAPGWDDDRVYEVADALLHGEQAPEPDPDELPATGARLQWLPPQGPAATPAEGLERADLVVDGKHVGSVEVGWEVDPFAIPLLQTAHRTGARVVLRHVAAPTIWRPAPRSPIRRHPAAEAGSRPAGRPRAVLLVTALHPDFASTDTLAALAVADVGVALDDPKAATRGPPTSSPAPTSPR
ncbi:putative cation-transporting ATPase I domain protein [Mycobacterium xenopi 4042]|uniref:Putative cation-transporting ATPase I domain protein n=1 Tax=Mycobacterium xenopi 4042 TaxID=1299334 RepID=X8CK65_MYCXE|nr:putative cation-transporting ATPase I domain protein [Mycobacterium xenopi 4042]